MVIQLVVYSQPTRFALQDKSSVFRVEMRFSIRTLMKGMTLLSVSRLSSDNHPSTPTRQIDFNQTREVILAEKSSEQLHMVIVEVTLGKAHIVDRVQIEALWVIQHLLQNVCYGIL